MKAYQSPARRKILDDDKARRELREVFEHKLREASVPRKVTVSTSSGEQYFVTVVSTK